MLIGRGFDVNNDGTNDFFIATQLSKKDRQEAGLLVAGLFIGGIAIYFAAFALAFVIVGLIWIGLGVLEFPTYFLYGLAVSCGCLLLVGLLKSPAFLSAILRARRPSQAHCEGSGLDQSSPQEVVAANNFWVRRGARMRGPVTESVIRSALKANKLCGHDEWAKHPSGPWHRLSGFP